MKYEPKHMRDTVPHDAAMPDNENGNDSVRDDSAAFGNHENTTRVLPRVHPLGIPVPDPGDAGEYIPIPGDNRVSIVNPSGAVVLNPWSQQPEIKPDYEYTDEKEDLDLLIM